MPHVANAVLRVSQRAHSGSAAARGDIPKQYPELRVEKACKHHIRKEVEDAQSHLAPIENEVGQVCADERKDGTTRARLNDGSRAARVEDSVERAIDATSHVDCCHS
eukprot:CAMPEP_0119338500 /NCGR_PEP_ID=MMETSP1333-20130426/96229_1 /TAXON_ID=418940 /ORGANISM="Scyphosphaera apsteinii, Strain RCC1455" /LENGTH=106 /DNA_ID=CAMNT_0007349805 /DNA_START=119 /DNA_END=436 /DNA_ORIENTATION=+